jgi:hypothetical protein
LAINVTSAGVPDLFVELRPPVGTPPSVWEAGHEHDVMSWDLVSILNSVSACVDQCDSLRARSEQGAASALMLRELVALVEDLVHARLPMPRPYGDVNCRWRAENTPTGISLSQQRLLLESLARLATHYLAACASLPEEEGKGPLLLTMATLVVFFDAAARVVARDAMSPLTAVLSGCDLNPTQTSLSDGETASAASVPPPAPPKVAFGLSLAHMMEKEVTFLERMCNEKIVDPTLLISRGGIEAYVRSVNDVPDAWGNGPPVPFLYGCKGGGSNTATRPGARARVLMMSATFAIEPSDPTGKFVAAMCAATGRGDSMSPLLEAHVRSTEETPSEAWRLSSWFVDQWIDIPEMAALRNLMLQFRFAASNMQTLKSAAIFDTGKATPRWMWMRGTIYCDMFGSRIRNLTGVPMVKPVNILTFVKKLTPTGTTSDSGSAAVAGVDATDLIGTLPRPRTFLDPSPSEEDVCLTKQQQLYSFEGTFSAEDSARLATLLTAEYIRIPLLLQFFCSSRAGSLLHSDVRNLLESVLFDVLPVEALTSAYTSNTADLLGSFESKHSTVVSAERESSATDDFIASMSAALGPFCEVPVQPQCRNQLGSMHGALMQELSMNPEAVLRPLMRLLKSCRELCTADYRSPFSSLAVWVTRQLTRVETFAVLMLRVKAVVGPDAVTLTSLLAEVRHELINHALPLLWACIGQANRADDIAKCCLFHTACVMMFYNATAEELKAPFPPGLLAAATGRSTRVSMASIDDSSSVLPENGYFVLLSGIMYINAWHAHVPTLPDRSSPGSVPFAGVYRALQRHRESLLRWMTDTSAASAGERDAALNALMRCALRKPTAMTLNWTPASALNQRCQMVLESPHPSPPGIDMYKLISFPGAPYISVRFDDRTQLERVSDFIAFYKDTTYTSLWGGRKFSGQPGTDDAFSWPGACGKGPLIIPSDTIYVHFHTDATVSYWGFKCHFSAPVCTESINTLSQWVFDESIIPVEEVPRDLNGIIATMLADACNDISEVKRALNAGEWKHRPGSSEGAVVDVTADADAAVETVNVKAGLYGDSVGRLEMNLQTCELYVCKQLQNPVPLAISQHPDFQALFENEKEAQLPDASTNTPVKEKDKGAAPSSLTCTAICNNVHRKWIQMTKGVLTYDIQLWHPLKQGDEALLPDEAAIADGSTCVHYKELDDCYVSHGLPRIVEVADSGVESIAQREAIEASALDCLGAVNKALCYRRRLYRTPYQLHTSFFGPDSAVLDSIIQDAIQAASLSKPPFIFLEESGNDASSLKEKCLLLLLSPQGDTPSARNGLGTFFDIRLRLSQPDLGLQPQVLVYQLIDHARSAQRVLVYSSDNTFSLRQLEINGTHRWQPWQESTQNEAGQLFGALAPQEPRFAEDRTGWDSNLDNPADDMPASWPWISDIAIDLHLEQMSGMEFTAVNGPIGGENEHAIQRLANRRQAPESVGSLHVSRYIALSEFNMGVRASSAVEVKEVFVPCRDLSGLLPDAILRQYAFWQRDTQPTRKLVGYPRGEPPKLHHTVQPHGTFNSLGFDEEQLLQVEFQASGTALITSEDKAAAFAGEGERAARQLLTVAHGLKVTAPQPITFSRRLTLLNAACADEFSRMCGCCCNPCAGLNHCRIPWCGDVLITFAHMVRPTPVVFCWRASSFHGCTKVSVCSTSPTDKLFEWPVWTTRGCISVAPTH